MTGPASSPDWDKIGRYLAGESSPDEAAEVRRWLDEHPADAQLVAALDGAAKQASKPAVDVEAALLRVKARAKTKASKAAWRFAGFAAAAAVIALAAVLVPWQSLFIDVGADAYQTIAFGTDVGRRDSVRLPDGSQVVLGPDSRIQFNQGDGTLRAVRLEGQAFFKVVHDDQRPFTVRAGGAVIRDIGTEFSVHSDAGEPVRVVVHEGAVEVTASNSATLHPGDVAVVTEGGVVEAKRGGATPDDLAWTRGQLVFRNVPLAELSADLRRWYGVELRVTDSALLRRHFTGSFADEPADRVLDAIALALGARIERRGDTAFVRPSRTMPKR